MYLGSFVALFVRGSDYQLWNKKIGHGKQNGKLLKFHVSVACWLIIRLNCCSYREDIPGGASKISCFSNFVFFFYYFFCFPNLNRNSIILFLPLQFVFFLMMRIIFQKIACLSDSFHSRRPLSGCVKVDRGTFSKTRIPKKGVSI